MRKILLALAGLLFVLTPAFGQHPLPVSHIPYYDSQSRPGWEERGPEFRPWLARAVKVTRYGGGGGSGTICYYDSAENWAYVISCGHLFRSGYKSAEDYKQSPDVRKITTWYHNDKKLDEPKEYKADVLCHVWNGVYDVSLMRFKPDWVPWTAPIAPEDYKLVKGQTYHSTGCDGLREVAHYLVKYEQEREAKGVTEILTTENGPRNGRSGGGVMTDDYQLLFICSRGGGGYGYWSSLLQIHKFLKAEGFEFILMGAMARRIPIQDHDNPGREYPRDYIPLPSAKL